MTQDIKMKYAAAGLGMILFLGGGVWLIRSEGRRTRESLREAAREAGSEIRQGLVEGAGRAVEKAGELPGQVIRDVKKELPDGTAQDVAQAVKDVSRMPGGIVGGIKDVLVGKPQERPAEAPVGKRPADRPPAPPSTSPAGTQPSHDKPAATSQEVPGPAKQASPATPPADAKPSARPDAESKPATKRREPADPIATLFDLGHKVAKSVDEVGQEVLGLSLEEELKLGPEVHQLVAQQQKTLSPPTVVQRLQRLARPILELRSRKNMTYRLLVVDSPDVNAFAHVGGYVYVTQGMLKFAANDAELQFVLAHEIAHVDLKHVTKRMTYAARASAAGGAAAGTLVQMAYMVIALGYSEDEEFEADAWALRAMLKTGRGRSESLGGLRHLQGYLREKEREPKRAAPQNAAEQALQQIEDHFRSHPPTEERVKRLETLEMDGD
jgi:Zn-dependent protease with chaperone function